MIKYTKIILIIFALIGIILILLIAFVNPVIESDGKPMEEEIVKEIVKCYDKKGNEIIGVECIDYKYPDENPTLIIFMFIVFILTMSFLDYDKW